MIALVGDIGGSRIKLAVARDGSILARRIEPVQAELPWQHRLLALAETWRTLVREAQIDFTTVDAIGVGFPSLVDSAHGRILDEWGKFPGCANFDLRSWASRTLGKPLALENDARAAWP